MKTRRIALPAILMLLLASGCETAQQGWKQECEIDNPFISAEHGQANENPLLGTFEVGAKKQFHSWSPFEAMERGASADWTALFGLRDPELSAD